MFKAIIAIVVVTIVVLVALTVVDGYSGEVGENYETSHISESEGERIEVTISGEIKRPGTYLVSEGATLLDLIESAGGATSNADEKAYETSFLLENKLTFYIAPLFDQTNVCATTPIEKVCLNTDSKETLMEGTALTSNQADGIVEYRQSQRFERIEEIQNVSGIGPATFEKCKDYITLYD